MFPFCFFNEKYIHELIFIQISDRDGEYETREVSFRVAGDEATVLNVTMERRTARKATLPPLNVDISSSEDSPIPDSANNVTTPNHVVDITTTSYYGFRFGNDEEADTNPFQVISSSAPPHLFLCYTRNLFLILIILIAIFIH